MANNERIRSNLTHELKHLLLDKDAAQVARHLGVHIDGIWVRADLLPEPIDANKAVSELEFAGSRMLPFDTKKGS